MDDGALEARLFPVPDGPVIDRSEPDWSAIHAEMKHKGVTLTLLWEEYRADHADGYGYSRFCDLYRQWRGRTSPVMRQVHQAGDKLFVDFAGMTFDIYLPDGEVRATQLFVAVMGASGLTFATLCWSQGLEDWIDAHACALAFFGGVPKAIIPDNLKSGVTSPRATSRASTAPMPSSPPTMRPPSCQRASIVPVTRPRSKPGCWSLNAGS